MLKVLEILVLTLVLIMQQQVSTLNLNEVTEESKITITTISNNNEFEDLTTLPSPSPPASASNSTSRPPSTLASLPVLSTLLDNQNKLYCQPALCSLYNGTHVVQVPHTACNNNGEFSKACGHKPHLLFMSERRRNLILEMHNLARSRIAGGHLNGYKPASHMPMLKWDNELEYLASLHVKRCQFAHDQCRNTARYQFSGQNIGIFWINRDFKSHSKRMKWFIINWFREYHDANQTFIDHYHPHPEGKKIGHFTMLVADRAHRVGCAAVRFRDLKNREQMKFLLTCNYDFNNIINEPVYQSGPTATRCSYKISEQYPELCDWKDAVYDYDSAESLEDDNLLDNNIVVRF